MPTKSEKLRKMKGVEADKRKKMAAGFYQEKSDQDDTLEHVESLRIETSDKTRRSAKKNNNT